MSTLLIAAKKICKPNRISIFFKNIVWAKSDNLLNYDEFVKLKLIQEDNIIDYFKDYANTELKKNIDYIIEIITKDINKNHKILLHVDNSVHNNPDFFIKLLSKRFY